MQVLIPENTSVLRAIIVSFFFQGTYLVLGMYMLLLYIQNRKKDYLLYGIYLLVFMLYFFLRIDSVLKFDFFSSVQISHHQFLTPLLLFITGIYVKFISTFAEIKKYNKSFAKRLKIFSYLLYVIGLSIFAFTLVTKDFQTVEAHKHFVFIPMHLYTLAALIRAFFVVKSEIRHYVLWANVCLFAFSTVGVYSAQGDGLVQNISSNHLFGFYTFNASQLGTFLEMLCFSLGLGHKFKLIESEKNEVKKKYIQELKKNEIVTKKLNKDLANLVTERTKEIEAKTKLLEDAYLLRSKFFENISHEFRTPLTLIKSPVDNALKKGAKLPENVLRMIAQNAQRLGILINDLLSLSRIQTGKMELKKTVQNPLLQLRRITAQFESYAEEKKIDYQAHIAPGSVSAKYDKRVLEKTVTNLISNAFKYTQTKGEILVIGSLVENKIILKIKDTGIGISKKGQKKIFDRFYQEGEKDENIPGSGIGLSLVKELAEIHGGAVCVKSVLGKGSTFMLELKLEEVVEIKTMEPFRTEQTGLVNQTNKIEHNSSFENNKPKLLLVEDNNDLRNYLGDELHVNFNVILAKNGEEGYEKAVKFVPDLILSDWMMPKMDGLMLCKLIKENGVTSHIPFVMLTAKSDINDKLQIYETGADAYIGKPFNLEILMSQIKNFIRQRKVLVDKFKESKNFIPHNAFVNSREKEFWRHLSDFLAKKLDDASLSSEIIAKELCMSRMQLHRKLKSLTGLSTTEFVRRERLKKAIQILKNSDLSINEVAYMVGFNTPSYFIKCFKEAYKKTPAEYLQVGN